MIIKLKELSVAISKLSDLASGDKNVAGIMFDIKDDTIDVCYTDGSNKVLAETIKAETSEMDVKEKIVFNYLAFTRIIEACKPTGKIITDTVDFEFCENQVIKVKAEKKVPINDSEDTKTVSLIEQSIGWIKSDSGTRVASLDRENYDLLRHYDEQFIQENYPTDPEKAQKIRPLSTSEWESSRDEWDIAELKSTLSKLSIENGKLVYLAPSAKTAFVNNTSCVICIPLKNKIKNKVILSSSMAKSLANVLGKVNSTDGKIYLHMISPEIVVYSTGDNTGAISIKNAKQDNNNITQMGYAMARDYSQYMLNFNREVLESCLMGAKTAGASDKATVTFEVETDSKGKKLVKLIMAAKNTNSSTDNKYDVMAEYAADITDTLADLKISIVLDVLHQAVSQATTEYIALDIHVEDKGSKYIRIGEIDLDLRAEVSEKNKVSGSWTLEFTQEHRSEILGYTTYFAVGEE